MCFSLETIITMFGVIKSFGDFFQISRIHHGIWGCIVMEIIEKSGSFVSEIGWEPSW